MAAAAGTTRRSGATRSGAPPEFAVTRDFNAGGAPGHWNVAHRRTGRTLNLQELPNLPIAKQLAVALTQETTIDWPNITTDDQVRALRFESVEMAMTILKRPEYQFPQKPA